MARSNVPSSHAYWPASLSLSMFLKYKPEQATSQISILFSHALGVRVMEAHRQLHQAYTHDISYYSTCIHRTTRFAQGGYRLEDKNSSGRPIDVNLKLLRKLIKKSLYQTTHELSKGFRCHYLTIRRKLIPLGKGQRICRRQLTISTPSGSGGGWRRRSFFSRYTRRRIG